jgi:hypothetical protein
MKTDREQSLEWFNSKSSLEKTRLTDTNTELVRNVRRYESLTGREIELIWKKETQEIKTFKVGDKVKIPITNTSGWDDKLNFKQSLIDYKLNYLIVNQVWSDEDPNDKEISVKRADDKNLEQDVFHEDDLEHYEEYNETFNPINHSDLVIDFDKEQIDLDSEFTGALNELLLSKVETIEEAAKRFREEDNYPYEYEDDEGRHVDIFIAGAKSDAARNYWYQKFIEEQNKQFK